MTDYSRFEIPVLVRRGGKCNVPDVDHIAYCSFTAEEMLTPIPEGGEYGQVTNEDGTARQRILAECLGVESVAGCHRIAPIHFDTGRNDVFRGESLAIWDGYLTPLGKGSETWLTQDEYIYLMQSKYANPESL